MIGGVVYFHTRLTKGRYIKHRINLSHYVTLCLYKFLNKFDFVSRIEVKTKIDCRIKISNFIESYSIFEYVDHRVKLGS